MEILTGILFDVSGYRKETIGGEIEEDKCEWARSIFEVIENFLKYDVAEKNYIFALGVGFKYGKGIFDVLETIELFDKRSRGCSYGQRSYVNDRQERCFIGDAIVLHDKPLLPGDEHWTIELARYNYIVERIFQIAERNGAEQTRKWVLKETIQSAIPYQTASLLLSALESRREFVKEFVGECLSLGCKHKSFSCKFFDKIDSVNCKLFDKIGSLRPTENRLEASTGDIIQRVENAMGRLLKDMGSVYSVQRASEILHGCIDAKTLTEDRIKRLMTSLRPFCSSGRPLFEALHKTTEIFQKDKYLQHKKLLFVFSDGESTDTYLSSVFEKLKQLQVTVVCFLIKRRENIQPRSLYSVEDDKWSKGAKFLFKLSSTISSRLLPRSIFFKSGWVISITNSKTKLFLQMTHHTDIHDACNLARYVICCEVLLTNLLVSVSIDIYPNQNIYGFTAQEQVDGTCYAYAAATIICLSTKRILGREGGYPDFKKLREEIINVHGRSGANTLNVLKEFCPKYRLHCKAVDINDAKNAVNTKRPVVATFRLNDIEWVKFSKYFKENRTGILTKSHIDTREVEYEGDQSGHAVILTGFNDRSLRLMNSWGDEWADKGFFKVENSEVLDFKFIDVFWTPNDLSPNEIDYFEKYGHDRSETNANDQNNTNDPYERSVYELQYSLGL